MTTRDQLLRRFRHFITAGGILEDPGNDDALLCKARGESEQEKLENIECVLSLIPQGYWEKWEK